jgi:hypothetical protein
MVFPHWFAFCLFLSPSLSLRGRQHGPLDSPPPPHTPPHRPTLRLTSGPRLPGLHFKNNSSSSWMRFHRNRSIRFYSTAFKPTPRPRLSTFRKVPSGSFATRLITPSNISTTVNHTENIRPLVTYTVKKASRNSDVDNGGANQTMWVLENSYSHVVWFCATVVSIGVWRIPTWLFLQCIVIFRIITPDLILWHNTLKRLSGETSRNSVARYSYFLESL